LLVFHIGSLKEDAKELGFLRLLVFHMGSLKEDAKEFLFSRACAADCRVLSNLHSKDCNQGWFPEIDFISRGFSNLLPHLLKEDLQRVGFWRSCRKGFSNLLTQRL
jgi:hypothetical protein